MAWLGNAGCFKGIYKASRVKKILLSYIMGDPHSRDCSHEDAEQAAQICHGEFQYKSAVGPCALCSKRLSLLADGQAEKANTLSTVCSSITSVHNWSVLSHILCRSRSSARAAVSTPLT